MRREEGLAVLRKVVLVGLEQAVEPGQPVAHAVVRVEDDGHPVQLRELAHLERARDAARDGRLVRLARGHGLAREELAAAAGELDDHGAAELGGRLHARVDAARRHGVHGRDREALLLGVGEEVDEGLAGHDAGLDRRRQRDGRGLEGRRAGRGPRGRDERRRAGEGEGDDDGLHLLRRVTWCGGCVRAAFVMWRRDGAPVSARRRSLIFAATRARFGRAVPPACARCSAGHAQATAPCNARARRLLWARIHGLATALPRRAQARIFG